jgi:hypothetical protein
MSNVIPLVLCIPKIPANTPRQTIFDTFCKLNIGYVDRITENPLRTNASFKRILIRIKWDNEKPNAKKIQEVLKDPKEHINIVYDMPWFWQVYANHPQK